jgi:hypothetical protein
MHQLLVCQSVMLQAEELRSIMLQTAATSEATG